MDSRSYFEGLRREAIKAEVMKATPRGLDDLDAWLRDVKNIGDGAVREFQAERIHLLEDPTHGQPFSSRLAEYVEAYASRLIGALADPPAIKARKVSHLKQMLMSIRKASKQSRSPAGIPLYRLLVNGLRRNAVLTPGMADPLQPADETSLFDVAPEDGLVDIGKALRVYVIGDLHGDAHTARMVTAWLRRRLTEAAPGSVRPVAVFLGDYSNNGLRSIAVLESLLRLQTDLPESVVLASGNHEYSESFGTALTELFRTHWDQWIRLSSRLTPRWKSPPRHYGHIRLDLVSRYGAEVGEAVHRKCELWGRSLPFCARYGSTFICHSIGTRGPDGLPLPLGDIAKAKKNVADIRKLVFCGYEAWKKDRESLHATMVNNRNITAGMLGDLESAVHAGLFVVGHTHFRAGDRDLVEGGHLRRAVGSEPGCLATVCSSHQRSPDAGHYIAREFEWARREVAETDERSRDGAATSCVAVIEESTVELHMDNLLPLHRLPGV